jgi:hypothetical protein
MYDSDGRIREDVDNTSVITSITYADLTTQTDDSNDHTDEWWPDAPDTNEGLNWDIRYTSLSETGTASARYKFRTTAPADRTEDQWYLLDDVSNDGGDATANGAWGVYRSNGPVKAPETGTATQACTVEIRATGSGSAVASHSLSLTVVGVA